MVSINQVAFCQAFVTSFRLLKDGQRYNSFYAQKILYLRDEFCFLFKNLQVEVEGNFTNIIWSLMPFHLCPPRQGRSLVKSNKNRESHCNFLTQLFLCVIQCILTLLQTNIFPTCLNYRNFVSIYLCHIQ